jgi:hypothetical protein
MLSVEGFVKSRLAARLTEDAQAETRNVLEFLDAVRQGVDVAIEPSIVHPQIRGPSSSRLSPPQEGTNPDSTKIDDVVRKEQLKKLVENRVQELISSLKESPRIAHVTDTIKAAIPLSVLDHKLSDEEAKDANGKFTVALDKFVEKGAEFSFHPLSKILIEVGTPEIIRESIKELYKTKILYMSKNITEPLARLLYHPSGVEYKAAMVKIGEVVAEPVFDVKSIPINISHTESLRV